MLIFLYSANAKDGSYDVLSMITALALFIIGLIVFSKGRKKEKQDQEENKK